MAYLKDIFPHLREDVLKDVCQDNFLDLDATITEIVDKSCAGNVKNYFLLPLHIHECHDTDTTLVNTLRKRPRS